MKRKSAFLMATIAYILLSAPACTGPKQLSLKESHKRSNLRTVRPKLIDDVLYNPGMGFTTAGCFDGDAAGYPKSTIAYWGWYWDKIEPNNGQFRWDIIDKTLKEAKSRGQRLAIRIMPSNGRSGVPQWYRELGAKGFAYTSESGGKNWMPDHNDMLYLKYMGRLVKEFGKRYDGHPDIDHVDIRSLGHWGEWHFGYVKPRPIVKPEIRRALVDIYLDSFKKTRLVMLINGGKELAYAVSKGAGWRADCLGDLRAGWNHMEDKYQQCLDQANANNIWKRAPVIFESCWVMQHWAEKGWDVDFIFSEALRWHCSVFNNKSSPIPPKWWPATEKFLKKMGYRLVLRYITVPTKVKAGNELKIEAEWENLGVAPPYRKYTVAFRLRPLGHRRSRAIPIKDPETDIDVRKWLPGKHQICLDLQIPVTIEPGRYYLDVGILDPYTREPTVSLAIEGRDGQGWYSLSELEVTE